MLLVLVAMRVQKKGFEIINIASHRMGSYSLGGAQISCDFYVLFALVGVPPRHPRLPACVYLILLTRTRDCWSRMCSVLSRSISVRAPKSPVLLYFDIS